MKAKPFGALIALTTLAWAGASYAQTPYALGESARCNTMTGEQKEQCLRDEANKTQGAPADAASSGASRAPSTSGEKYGRAARCDTMTGAEKQSCLIEEARKAASPAKLQAPD